MRRSVRSPAQETDAFVVKPTVSFAAAATFRQARPRRDHRAPAAEEAEKAPCDDGFELLSFQLCFCCPCLAGIAKIPPGFGSEGWGWGKGRGFRESPPEWRRRFSRAREALEVGQIAGSPALLAAQALLVECRDVRLLRLPDSAAAMWSSR